MENIVCPTCGSNHLEDLDNEYLQCTYCGTKTIVKNYNEHMKVIYQRALHLRNLKQFDEAIKEYMYLMKEDTKNPEAYWGLVLCKYGIEFVDDYNKEQKVTCHRAIKNSIYNDFDYIKAIEFANESIKQDYMVIAAEIDLVQKHILMESSQTEQYDIFISYKQTDDTTNQKTKDFVIAQEIYDKLTSKGYKVFFSFAALKNKAGTKYEPIIFNALQTSKMMLVIGTKTEYINSSWVKNEWGRYIKLTANDDKRLLVPIYKDIDASELPRELLPYQGIDYSKVGSLNELLIIVDHQFKHFFKKQTQPNEHYNNKTNLTEGNEFEQEVKKSRLDQLRDKVSEGFNKIVDNTAAKLNKATNYRQTTDGKKIRKIKMEDKKTYIAIYTMDDLQKVSQDTNRNFILMNDLDATGYLFTPIGLSGLKRFKGIFDGNNKTIKNLKITQITNRVIKCGLFYNNMGHIKNLKLENFRLEVESIQQIDCGAIAGFNTGSIYNCSVSGNMIVSGAKAPLIIGGIVGQNKGFISDVLNKMDIRIHGKNMYVGGIVGTSTSSTSRLSTCISTGSIDIENSDQMRVINVGGLVGISRFITLINSYATSPIIIHSKHKRAKYSLGGTFGSYFNGKLINVFRYEDQLIRLEDETIEHKESGKVKKLTDAMLSKDSFYSNELDLNKAHWNIPSNLSKTNTPTIK